MTLPLAFALGEWIGFPASSFDVIASASGDGTLNSWDAVKFKVARPTDPECVALAKQYNRADFLGLSDEYLIAFVIAQELNDNTRLLAAKQKVAAWKAAHPGMNL